MSAQTAQKSPACPLGSSDEGPGGISAAAKSAASTVAGEVDLPASTCTWPNDRASWKASANSAHQAPKRMFERIQRIVAAHALFPSPRLANAAGGGCDRRASVEGIRLDLAQ